MVKALSHLARKVCASTSESLIQINYISLGNNGYDEVTTTLLLRRGETSPSKERFRLPLFARTITPVQLDSQRNRVLDLHLRRS